ncbi:MAG: DUF4339 domain-containing protein [Phycisphaerae bacterium]
MAQWYCLANGQQHGPVDEDTLRQWIGENRLTRSDLVWREGMDEWVAVSAVPELSGSQPPSAPSPYSPPRAGPQARSSTVPAGMQPHRGETILILSILSWFTCFILGIVALVMAGNDLQEMDAGRMDPAGRSLTNAGRVIALIQMALLAAFLVAILAVAAGMFASA